MLTSPQCDFTPKQISWGPKGNRLRGSHPREKVISAVHQRDCQIANNKTSWPRKDHWWTSLRGTIVWLLQKALRRTFQLISEQVWNYYLPRTAIIYRRMPHLEGNVRPCGRAVGCSWSANRQTLTAQLPLRQTDKQHESLPSRYSTNLSSGKLSFLLLTEKNKGRFVRTQWSLP